MRERGEPQNHVLDISYRAFSNLTSANVGLRDLQEMTPLDQVREWSIALGVYVAEKPSFPGPSIAALRMRLIEEEIVELYDAVVLRNSIAALDALCDLEYVVQGSFLAFGLDRIIDPAREHHLQEVALRPIGVAFKPVESLITGMRQQVGGLYIAIGERSLRRVQEALSNILHKIDMAFAVSGLEPIRREAFDHVHFCNLSKILKGLNTVKPDKRLGELIGGLSKGKATA